MLVGDGFATNEAKRSGILNFDELRNPPILNQNPVRPRRTGEPFLECKAREIHKPDSSRTSMSILTFIRLFTLGVWHHFRSSSHGIRSQAPNYLSAKVCLTEREKYVFRVLLRRRIAIVTAERMMIATVDCFRSSKPRNCSLFNFVFLRENFSRYRKIVSLHHFEILTLERAIRFYLNHFFAQFM